MISAKKLVKAGATTVVACVCAIAAVVGVQNSDEAPVVTIMSGDQEHLAHLQSVAAVLQSKIYAITNDPYAFASNWVSDAETRLPADYRTDGETNLLEQTLYAVEANPTNWTNLKLRQMVFTLQRVQAEIGGLQ